MKGSRSMRERLAILRDLTADEQAELLDAVAGDPELQQVLDEYRRLDSLLGEMPDVKPDPKLRRRFYEAVERADARAGWWALLGRTMQAGGRLAVAAVGILIVAGIGLLFRSQLLVALRPPQEPAAVGSVVVTETPVLQMGEPPLAPAYPAPNPSPTPALQAYPEPELAPDPDAVVGVAPVFGPLQMRLSTWSPDGSYLAFWQYDTADVAANPQFPAGTLSFFDVESGRTCTYPRDAYDGAGGLVEQHAWLNDGRLLVFNDDGSYTVAEVCAEDDGQVSGPAPLTIERIMAANVDHDQWLLLGADGYALATLQRDALAFQLIAGLTASPSDAAAFSPDGALVAVNHGEGGTTVLAAGDGAIVHRVEWQSPGGLGSIFAPNWLDNRQILIRSTQDRGALLVDLDSEVQTVGSALLQQEPASGLVSEGARLLGGGFALASYYMPGSDGYRDGVWYSNSGSGVAEHLPFDRAAFAADGRLLMLFVDYDEGAEVQNEIWWANTSGRPLSPELLYEGGQYPYAEAAPQGNGLALVVGNELSLIEDAESRKDAQQLADVLYGSVPLWAPTGEYVALLGGYSGRPENFLYVIPVR